MKNQRHTKESISGGNKAKPGGERKEDISKMRRKALKMQDHFRKHVLPKLEKEELNDKHNTIIYKRKVI